jgi:hypothetical protein
MEAFMIAINVKLLTSALPPKTFAWGRQFQMIRLTIMFGA